MVFDHAVAAGLAHPRHFDHAVGAGHAHRRLSGCADEGLSVKAAGTFDAEGAHGIVLDVDCGNSTIGAAATPIERAYGIVPDVDCGNPGISATATSIERTYGTVPDADGRARVERTSRGFDATGAARAYQ